MNIDLRVDLLDNGSFQWSIEGLSEEEEEEVIDNIGLEFFADKISSAIELHAPEPGTFYLRVKV